MLRPKLLGNDGAGIAENPANQQDDEINWQRSKRLKTVITEDGIGRNDAIQVEEPREVSFVELRTSKKANGTTQSYCKR